MVFLACVHLTLFLALSLSLSVAISIYYRKLGSRRGIARRAVSVEILLAVTQHFTFFQLWKQVEQQIRNKSTCLEHCDNDRRAVKYSAKYLGITSIFLIFNKWTGSHYAVKLSEMMQLSSISGSDRHLTDEARRVDRRKCGQQTRPSTSFAANTINSRRQNFRSLEQSDRKQCPYLWRHQNFLIRQCRKDGRKLPRQKLARSV